MIEYIGLASRRLTITRVMALIGLFSLLIAQSSLAQTVTRGQAEFESKDSRRKDFAETAPGVEAAPAEPVVEAVPE